MIAPSAFRVTHLQKRFARTIAVDDISFEAPAGRFTCLVGPSGCGKTTLLRLLAGLETPTSGAIHMEGRDVTRLAAARRGVGMVFQSYALFPNMTVGANIAFGMKGRRTSAMRAERTAELLALVGLPGLADRMPAQLSGGQQQRIAMARALATDPRVLLLDEPLAALDPQIREQLRGELRSLQQRLGVTTVMVTHDQAEALAIADLMVVMRNGRIEQIGAPEQVYDAPASAFVASFLGAANLLDAEVISDGAIALASAQVLLAETGAFTAGRRVIAAIRPEAVKLTSESRGAIRGQVRGVDFGGSTTRLQVQLAGADASLMVELHAGAPRPIQGELVWLHAAPDKIRLYPSASDQGRSR